MNVGDERGAFAVMVALLLVALLGFGALVIDVGALVQERRELQNGADAAAFAVAQDCALGNCGVPLATADEYVDANAVDADSEPAVCGEGGGAVLDSCSEPPTLPAGASGYVRVAGSTREASSGSDQISFTLARAMGFDGATVQMSATVAWGAPASATTTPLTISKCEYDEFMALNGNTFAEGPPFSADLDPIVAYFHNASSGNGDQPCPSGPAGQDVPGGFGWLRDEDEDCQADSNADGTYFADTGADVPQACKDALAGWLNTTVLIPVYDEVVEPGTNAQYRIVGYAAYHIVGYKFSGGPANWQGAYQLCANNGGSCLVGYFTDYVTSADDFGGPQMGAVAVKLIG